MATPKKTKTSKSQVPTFPTTVYAAKGYDNNYNNYAVEALDVINDESPYVAEYVLNVVKKVNIVPEQITLENI